MRVDRGLEGALARGAEVLFSTDMDGRGGGGDGSGSGSWSGSGSGSGSEMMKSLQRTLSKGRNNQRTAASTNRLLDALLMGDDPKDGSPNPNPNPNPSSNLLHNLYLAVPTNLEGKLLRLLDVQPFSTSVKTSLNREGGLVGDDIRRRVDPLEAIPPRMATPRRGPAVDPLGQAPQFIKRASDKFVK